MEQVEFQEFINQMRIVDVPVMGKRFTWFSGDCSVISRLDLFLVSQDLIKLWGVSSQWVGKRNIDDRCPIALQTGLQDWGLKPFKFFNSWLEHPGFVRLLGEWWRDFHVTGWKSFVCKDKLKLLKENIRVWQQEVYGGSSVEIFALVDDWMSCTKGCAMRCWWIISNTDYLS